MGIRSSGKLVATGVRRLCTSEDEEAERRRRALHCRTGQRSAHGQRIAIVMLGSDCHFSVGLPSDLVELFLQDKTFVRVVGPQGVACYFYSAVMWFPQVLMRSDDDCMTRGPAPSHFFLPTYLLLATLSPVPLLSCCRSPCRTPLPPLPDHHLLSLSIVGSPTPTTIAIDQSSVALLCRSPRWTLLPRRCQPPASLLSSPSSLCKPLPSLLPPIAPVARSSTAPHDAAFLPCLPAIVAGQPLAMYSQWSLDLLCCLLCRSVVAHNNVVVVASQPHSPAATALVGLSLPSSFLLCQPQPS
ncbi:hypothetical protein BHM03_00054938 [Ensete ventricosum]|nr:hypothetical protein BHM03_00054938 [Ensete ventricosum]